MQQVCGQKKRPTRLPQRVITYAHLSHWNHYMGLTSKPEALRSQKHQKPGVVTEQAQFAPSLEWLSASRRRYSVADLSSERP